LLLNSSPSGGQVFYTITDSRDGQAYWVVHIDDLWWMAENLNVGTLVNVRFDQVDNDNIEKYCYLNNEVNCDLYGGLYQWGELMQYGNVEFYHGICPSGWHVSSDVEWKKLEAFLGMPQASIDSLGDFNNRGYDEGGMLKDLGDQWTAPNTLATNSVGFSALPAGYRDTISKDVEYIHWGAYFWNADTYGGKPIYRNLWYSNGKIGRDTSLSSFGVSARCIKDSPYMFGRSSLTDPRDGKEYATILIENHWWMAENLNVGARINHNVLPEDDGIMQKYCYNDLEAYCDTFGGLYQWKEAMKYEKEGKQGICPDGWHIPTDENWKELEFAAGMNEYLIDQEDCRGNEGNFLEMQGGSGFDVQMTGTVLPDGTSAFLGEYCDFWTSSKVRMEGYIDTSYWAREFKESASCIKRNGLYINENAFSIRCVKNDDEILSLSLEAEDTICPGQEIIVRATTSGGTSTKEFKWWSNPSGFSSNDSIIRVKPDITTIFNVRIKDGFIYSKDSVRVTVIGPEFNFSGDTNVCPSDEQLEYGVTDNASYSYSWGETDGNLIAHDENHALISWGTTPGYKHIDVTATDNATGCSTTKRLWVQVLESLKPEVILKGKSLLICTDSGQIYQWYHDGNALKKATQQFYYAKGNESGSYSVEITWENGCQNISNPKTFTEKSTADPGFHESQTVFIHPNPTDGNIILEMINDYLGSFKITVSNSNGSIVKQQRLNKFNPVYSTCLELDGLAEGSYIMAVDYGGIREVHRITIKK
jgi:uncharacterized protein (TIGR02145 family)